MCAEVVCAGVVCAGVVCAGVVCAGVVCAGDVCTGVVCAGVVCTHVRMALCSVVLWWLFSCTSAICGFTKRVDLNLCGIHTDEQLVELLDLTGCLQRRLEVVMSACDLAIKYNCIPMSATVATMKFAANCIHLIHPIRAQRCMILSCDMSSNESIALTV